MKQPEIEVGILTATEIRFQLNGLYTNSKISTPIDDSGIGHAIIKNGELVIILGNKEIVAANSIIFAPSHYNNASFDLHDVIIGIQFHWERKENQRFKGKLRLFIDGDKITAVNILPLEDYLLSVISSEMSATSSIELLKAHAVISRSWLIAQKEKENLLKEKGDYQTTIQTDDEYIRWFDREDHAHFDVCADDHCQRYQGITKVTTTYAQKAIDETRGEVLVYDGKICDARFSKCCGGVAESFENVWEPIVHPYLTKVIDNPEAPAGFDLDLTTEAAAEKWITGNPEAFCNTNDKHTLKQVLNDYDQETHDFYRWTVTFTQQQLSELLLRRTGFDFGNIIDIVPVERGVSGRLIRLKIIGSKKTLTLGKELIIRKAFSESHLYSSAFVIRKSEGNPYPQTFTLIGAGWGHGVGLCQIGAAVMGSKGYNYQQILKHYFRGASLEKKY